MLRANFHAKEELHVAALASASQPLASARRPRSLRRSLMIILFIATAAGILGAYAFFLASFWAPAPGRPGIDENAYLVAGKNIALSGSPGMKLADDFQFVDTMWVRTDTQDFPPAIWLPAPIKQLLTAHTQAGWYYPKYPIGLPALNALVIRLNKKASDFKARQAAFAISPVCMVLAAAGICLLTLMVSESPFYALLAMIVLITSPTALQLAELPNSHAPALCAVVWGMVLLVQFYRGGSLWFGAGAGLLLGFAVTFRYSEALLLFPLYPLDQVLSDTMLKTAHPIGWHVLMACRMLPIGPLGIAAMFTIRWRELRTYLRAAIPLMAWGLPVGFLLAFNWFSMGHLTGYDTTHESGGFTTQEFLRKWDFSIEHFYLYGLFVFAPLGVAGLGMMFRRQWRDALILTMWAVPGSLLYTAYYWGSQSPGMGFLRFLLTLFPPLIVGAMWLLKSAGSGWGDGRREGRSSGFAEPLLAGGLVAAAASIGLAGSLHVLIIQHLGNLNLAVSAENVDLVINPHDKAAGADGRHSTDRLLFADEGLFPPFLQYAQFMFDGTWYAADAFEPQAFGGFGFLGLMQSHSDNRSPTLVQQERIDHMMSLESGLTPAMLAEREIKLIDTALAAGRPVFAVLTSQQRSAMAAALSRGQLKLVKRASWAEPYNVPLELPDDSPPDSATHYIPRENLLVPPFDPGSGIFKWAPQSLGVYQIGRGG